MNKIVEANGDTDMISKIKDAYLGEDGMLTLALKSTEGFDIANSSLEETINKLRDGSADWEKMISDIDIIEKDTEDRIDTMQSKIASAYSSISETMNQVAAEGATFTNNMETQVNKIVDILSKLGDSFNTFANLGSSIGSILNTKQTEAETDLNTNIEDIDASISTISSQIDAGFTAITNGEKYEKIASAETGGYTGAWGSEGKLAILHEKELVLNANDTENILAATQIARSLGQVFDEISKIITGDAMSYVNNHSNTMTNANISNGQNVDQNVQIEAHFPNVTDRDEIQEAFDNLINLAVQKAFEEE
jgi:chaperonin cofactor prefoldin